MKIILPRLVVCWSENDFMIDDGGNYFSVGLGILVAVVAVVVTILCSFLQTELIKPIAMLSFFFFFFPRKKETVCHGT
jgi:hypothetical protein